MDNTFRERYKNILKCLFVTFFTKILECYVYGITNYMLCHCELCWSVTGKMQKMEFETSALSGLKHFHLSVTSDRISSVLLKILMRG